MRILAFSKYLAYAMGGAEISTVELLRKRKGCDIELLSFENPKGFPTKGRSNVFPSGWKISYIHHVFNFKRFVYLEYVLNRRKIRKYFQGMDSEIVLYSYGIYAPIAINAFPGKSELFIRSETDLAINQNYHIGFKGFLKRVYMCIEYPAFSLYKRDLEAAIKKSNLTCNSNYMANQLMSLYNKRSSVERPFVDVKDLKAVPSSFDDVSEKKGVVFIGDSEIKGLATAKKIASLLPSVKFYFFSRYVSQPAWDGNICWMPWQRDRKDIYKYAKVVIVPSVWQEAYGRASREAFLLDIPVLVSNRGGLPETVNGNKDCIVDEYLNPQAWSERIESYF